MAKPPAGFALRTARIDAVDFCYTEGPDNGPPLVLLPAQHMDWFSYGRVLPALGGLLAVWLAAVRGWPRTGPTWYGRLCLRTHHWIHSNRAFFTKNVAPGSAFLLAQAVKAYRLGRPGRPGRAIGLPRNDTVRRFLRGMDQYDPRFGAAFHDGSWNAGFDHAEALAAIRCPALLLQADFAVLPDGTLNGAMSQEDADQRSPCSPTASTAKSTLPTWCTWPIPTATSTCSRASSLIGSQAFAACA